MTAVSKVALIVRGGRNSVFRLMQEIARALKMHGHLGSGMQFRLYVSIDAKRDDLPTAIMQRADSLRDALAEVKTIDSGARKHIAATLSAMDGVSQRAVSALADNGPYADQLNCAILTALADNNDVAIFLDDDMSLIIPVVTQRDQVLWRSVDVIGTHLSALRSGALVSSGSVLGFVSPIPPSVFARLSAKARDALGAVFDGAHEVLHRDSFSRPNWKVMSEASWLSVLNEPPQFQQAKWLTPANMALNLRRDCPPFFTPFGSRGEDAFFALALGAEERVVSVDAPVYHDPFAQLPTVGMVRNTEQLMQGPDGPAAVNRFIDALFGWIAYLPLFLRILRYSGDSQFKIELKNRERLICHASTLIASDEYFARVALLPQHYRQYRLRVDEDFAGWLEAVATWRQTVRPSFAAVTANAALGLP